MTLNFAAYPLLSRANKIVPIAKAIHQLLRIQLPPRENIPSLDGALSSRLPDWALQSLLRFCWHHDCGQPLLAPRNQLRSSAPQVLPRKRDLSMPDSPRITVDELRKRMEAGEDFTIIDVRNPQAWAQSDSKIPEAIRVPMDEWEKHLAQIPKGRPVVAYCT